MGLFSYFKDEPKASASVAKERLQVLVAHERNQRNAPDFLPDLQRDIMAVIQKYIELDDDSIQVQVDNHDQLSVLEVNVTLPN
ncbi:cell division topological specificity factor MinE [Bermanella marisrubri]|uniref:Cell division topological specificity factor n=1 Tax=Bermanella marisrubri TaxID=207949 RepID=Q1N354_9GAMM|nr:cell division topological specificity factor MinE [Bermanella marisrubri]EAT12737.1 cell division topological specificity factor [Oceanobacter sp. RED65] [Bermanella marisrubri]QIZ85145.1 cell division topological specificity factor MinE [Bermanella marisrubri]